MNLENTLLFLVASRLNLDCNIDDDDFQELIKLGVIERDYISGTLIVKLPLFEGEDIDFIPARNIEKVRIEVLERIQEYRQLFTGVRAKSIGMKQTVIDNMIRWMLSNPDYTFDNILDATRYYIEMTERQYISNADNFIFREVRPGKEESLLLTVIEQLEFENLTGNKKSII